MLLIRPIRAHRHYIPSLQKNQNTLEILLYNYWEFRLSFSQICVSILFLFSLLICRVFCFKFGDFLSSAPSFLTDSFSLIFASCWFHFSRVYALKIVAPSLLSFVQWNMYCDFSMAACWYRLRIELWWLPALPAIPFIPTDVHRRQSFHWLARTWRIDPCIAREIHKQNLESSFIVQ